MLLGDFGDFRNEETTVENPDTWLDQTHNLAFLILFFFTLIMVIVMLNLLIAIISDSFEKVMALEQQSQNCEKLQLILEDQRNRGLYRKDNDKLKGGFIYQITSNEVQEESNNEERMRAKVDKLQQSFDELIKIQKKTYDNVRDDLIEIKSTLKKLDEKK